MCPTCLAHLITLIYRKDEAIMYLSPASYYFLFLQGNSKIAPVHASKAYMGVEVYLHPFIALALDGGQWSASYCGHFVQSKVSFPHIK